jgi:phage tail-like protein
MTPTTANGTSNGTGTRSIPDPIGDLTFHVEIDDHPIGYFAECSGLAVEYDTIEYVEGGNNMFTHRLRGHVKYPNVTLRRGVTFEDGLIKWFYAAEAPDKRPTVTITLYNEELVDIRHWALAAAQPVRWTGPDGKAGGNAAATESIEISHIGFV